MFITRVLFRFRSGELYPDLGQAQALVPLQRWRMVKGREKPFATIQRFSVSDPETSAARPVLVVTRLPPGPVCHVATIDVRANGGEANVLARQAADQLARDFRCDRPAGPFGKPGAAHTRLPVP